jgi:hypothetical protein
MQAKPMSIKKNKKKERKNNKPLLNGLRNAL